MSEREYQQKMLNSESKIVLCDWDRGKGKDYSIAQSIVRNIPNIPSRIVVFTNYNSRHVSGELFDNLSYMLGDECVEGRGLEVIVIKDSKGSKFLTIHIFNSSEIETIARGYKADYVYFNEYVPNKEQLDYICSDKLKQVYILGTFKFDYISDNNTVENINREQWIDNEIDKLMKEFSKTPNKENTTKTRESLLGMIEKLKNMRD